MNFLPEMINVVRDEEAEMTLLFHASLEVDFRKMANRRSWPVVPVHGNLPDSYVAYDILGKRPCEEIRKRIDEHNPFWVFDDSCDWP